MTQQTNIRALVRGAYDLQKLRIMSGNRVVANFKVRMGQEPGESEDELSDDAKQILSDLRAAYKRISDAGLTLSKISKAGTGDPLIADLSEYALIAGYDRLLSTEEEHFKMLGKVIEKMPIWTEFLDGVKGCGPAMAGVIISEIDITKARYASSLWKYAGLDVGPDGKGRSKRKEHLVEIAYTDRDGKEAVRQGITFNPFLKTKLLGVLGPSFLKCKSPYAEAYYNMKHRLESVPKGTSQPLPESEPKGGSHPALLSEPMEISNPETSSVSPVSSHPRVTSEPEPLSNPKGDSEPENSSQPIPTSEPSEGSKPTRPSDMTKLHIHNRCVRYMVKMFLIDLYKNWRTLEGLPVAPSYQEAKLGHIHRAA